MLGKYFQPATYQFSIGHGGAMRKYKNWSITYNPKPIPDRRFDYDAVHDDYDGPGDERFFSTSGIGAAMLEIDEYYS